RKGRSPVMWHEEGVQRALQFAMSEYNKASNDKFASRVAEVIQAKKQIVSGIRYILDVKVGRTTCTKSAPDMANHLTCNFVVYTIPWQNKISLVNNKCQ
uniref:Cystatin C n=1 Tax=Sphenodon punctatus TaxID=8508 RepID=A0A8D0GZY2_SPHPU